MKPGKVSHFSLWSNKCYNSINEGGNVVEVIWEGFTDVMEQLNGLRKVSYFVPDTHCTVDRLWKHTNTKFCKHSAVWHNMTILQLRPCKDSASCSLWCEKETSSSAASNIHRNIQSYTQHKNKNRWLKKHSVAWSLTGMLLMLRSKDCSVLRASEFCGKVKKRITSCLLCNTLRSCVGRKNHWLKKIVDIRLIFNNSILRKTAQISTFSPFNLWEYIKMAVTPPHFCSVILSMLQHRFFSNLVIRQYVVIFSIQNILFSSKGQTLLTEIKQVGFLTAAV